MTTQYKDGSFSDIEPFEEAIETFKKAVEDNNAKAFFIGTQKELIEREKEQYLIKKLSEMEEKLKSMESNENNPFCYPTDENVGKYTKTPKK